jgi:hypothetical protein
MDAKPMDERVCLQLKTPADNTVSARLFSAEDTRTGTIYCLLELVYCLLELVRTGTRVPHLQRAQRLGHTREVVVGGRQVGERAQAPCAETSGEVEVSRLVGRVG